MKPIQKAIDLVGGPTALARLLGNGVLQQHVTNWRRRGVPAERCIDIENAVGGQVTRYQLRPDVFGPEPEERDRRPAAAEGNSAAPTDEVTAQPLSEAA